MAVSAVDIANRALMKLGENGIRSFDDNTKASRLAQNSYDIIRRAELTKSLWNFAIVRDSLTYSVDSDGNPIVPSWLFGLTYPLPVNCLRVIQVSDIFNGMDLSEYRNQDTREYVIEGTNIITNMTGNAMNNVVLVDGVVPPQPLPILYVADITDTAQFSPLFVEALACQCAMEWCETITQSLSKCQAIAQVYKDTMRQARYVNATQNPPQNRPDNTWILTRVG